MAGSNEPSVETDASSNFDLGVLEQFIAAWVDAWQAQSLGAYFSAYHAEFEPRYQDSVSAWRSSREPVASGVLESLLFSAKRLRTRPSTSPSSRRERAVACTSAHTDGEHGYGAKRPGELRPRPSISPQRRHQTPNTHCRKWKGGWPHGERFEPKNVAARNRPTAHNTTALALARGAVGEGAHPTVTHHEHDA